MAGIEKLQNPLKITEIADKINEIIEGGTGGSGLVFGSTIFSLIPLTEAGLHLLDGSLLVVGGIYDEAITKIAALKSSNPNLFITEENWQQSVTTYGVCGKFVYTEGVSLRLPKVTGFVEGTLDATALGDLVEAGLPDIYASFAGVSNISPYGAVRKENDSVSPVSGATTGGGVCNLIFEASKWNSTYGNSDAVQPQSIKGYLYIVLATNTKTDVQVNIDNVVTDLNGKADKDLSNISENIAYIVDSYKDDDGDWFRKWSDGWVEQGGYNTKIGSKENVLINLLLPYVDTNYVAIITPTSIDLNTSNNTTTGIVGKTTTSFYAVTDHFSLPTSWYACGQGA